MTIGADTVVMENAVLKASGGSVSQFPLTIGDRCIVGPHAYLVGARSAKAASSPRGAKIFNGATLEDGSGVALGGIVHVNARVARERACRCCTSRLAIRRRSTRRSGAGSGGRDEFLRNRVQPRARATACARERRKPTRRFLRKTHAQDAALGEHRRRQTGRRGGPERSRRRRRPREVDKVVDVMMLELEEMEHRRQEAIKRQKA